LARCGLRVRAAIDDRERYLVTAARDGCGADDPGGKVSTEG
jgi:hypothetical protein